MNAAGVQPKLVIGVGASAGGLEAFKQLLAALPTDSDMAFLLVQHLDPTHKSLLPELLASQTGMEVQAADQDVPLRPNAVYIIRPDTSLAVREGKISVSTPTLHRGVRLPVDHLFRSLAKEYGPRAVGIILSGAGSDGSVGMREIKAVGGLAIAQEPSSSGQPGMPQSAIDTGMIDLVLPIAEMPQALERFASLPSGTMAEPATEREGSPAERRLDFEEATELAAPLVRLKEKELGQLAALLEAHLDFDLRVYKSATIERRVLRRLVLSGFTDVASYFEHLRQAPAEQQALVRDMLIGVTEFFRDPEAFRTLRERVIDPLVAKAPVDGGLRVWVAGCATGEEAYSLGIEILDAIRSQDKKLAVQIFATDIDQEALAVGRAGVYPLAIVEHVSERRLSRYFQILEGKGYQVRPALRDIVSFAAHDLTKDPPFSRMDLVSCRNVLIYLTPEAQKHVLHMLHFALQAGGHLMLSTSESTGSQRELFSTVSKSWRIYKKFGTSRPLSMQPAQTPLGPGRRSPLPASTSEPETLQGSDRDLARRTVLRALVPPTIVVSEEGAVLFMHGELGAYLRFPQGDNPRLELTSLLRPELAPRIRGALYKCRRSEKTVVALSSRDDRQDRIRIIANPAFDLEAGAVILTFEKVKSGKEEVLPSSAPDSPAQEALIAQLEKELQDTREDLSTTVEELETANEELRSANEESMSMNEELQSANEELEATTEELRSLNEELTTVNVQLREKVDLLERAHDDLSNFFSSTKVATIFLDENLRIKRFTPAAETLLDIDHGDIGRRIFDIARQLLQDDLSDDAKAVLEHLSARSREVHADERWFARQVLPYRTASRRIEGVVVTFADITERKLANEQRAIRERQQAMIARLGLAALRESDLEGFLERVVRDVQQTLDTDLCKILELQPGGERLLMRAGVGWQEGAVGSAHVSAGATSQAGYTLQSSEPVLVDDLATEKRFSGLPLLHEHAVVSGLSTVIRYGDNAYGVIGAHTTERRPFTAQDANFLQAVASVIGSALGRHQTRVQLALQLGVAQILAETTTDRAELDEALARILECFNEHLHTTVGEIWWRAAEGDNLSCRLLQVIPASDEERVSKGSSHSTGAPVEGLAQRVFTDGRAAWCTDLSDSALFTRPDGAEELGLVSGLGFPILAAGRALGVVTIFARKRLFVDTIFLHILEGIGRSIGEFVSRSRYEQRAVRLAAIAESAHDAILSYDDKGLVTEWLPGAEHLFGYSAEEMIATSIERIVPEEHRAQLWAVNKRIQRGERVEPFEGIRRCKDGRLIEVSIRSSPVRDRQGKVIGISSTDRDVTRLKETERQLVAADRQKDEFLAMLGHELRNPLAAIRSAAELLRRTHSDDADLQRTQAILERQSTHMAKLLDGLLDVSRIIRGKIRLDPEVVDFAAVCREVVSDVGERIPERTLKLRTEVPKHPVWVEADRIRLAQIVDNLLSNAVKYTEDNGEVTLTLEVENGHAILDVQDTGIGIEPDLLPYIFDVFRQSKQSLDRSLGGLGLGLALVKSLVELHGGRVEARSEGKGHGARFLVRLPTTHKTVTKTEVAPRESTTACILLIEDNEDAASALGHILELSGHEVTIAHRGMEGVAIAKERKPDVIICDLGLPDGASGFDVARLLRDDQAMKDIYLIALSGYGRPEDKTRSEAAGFDIHITKPVDVKILERILGTLGEQGTA